VGVPTSPVPRAVLKDPNPWSLLANTPGLSGTGDHPGWSLPRIGWVWPVPGPVAVSPSDQRWLRLGCEAIAGVAPRHACPGTD
jgi:hypothetical protein